MKTLLAEIETCCAPLLRAPLTTNEAEQLAAAFKVLADPARLRLLSLVAAREGGEACTCELVEPMGLSQPTVTHHLRVLHDAGLVKRERRGQYTYYQVVPERVAVLRAALDAPAAT